MHSISQPIRQLNCTECFHDYSSLAGVEGTPPINFLVVLSMTLCTKLSMGCTMKGITPSPSPVTAHFLALSATPGTVRARPIREKAQILLIRKPTKMGVKSSKLKILTVQTWNYDRSESLPHQSVKSCYRHLACV